MSHFFFLRVVLQTCIQRQRSWCQFVGSYFSDTCALTVFSYKSFSAFTKSFAVSSSRVSSTEKQIERITSEILHRSFPNGKINKKVVGFSTYNSSSWQDYQCRSHRCSTPSLWEFSRSDMQRSQTNFHWLSPNLFSSGYPCLLYTSPSPRDA